MRRVYSAVIALVIMGARLVLPSHTEAAVWTGAGRDGNWINHSNWNPTFAPSGRDAVADFSALDVIGDTTVALNANIVVGTLMFGDTVPSDNWNISPGTPADSTLTLDVTSGEPIINVVNQTATFRVVVAGTEGLTKTGLGTLVLTEPNTYSGTTVVRSGTLALDFSASELTSNIIPTASELRLGGIIAASGGGTIQLVGRPGASNTQTFTGTTLLFGQNGFEIDQNDAANVDLFLGFFDRDLGSVANFTLPTSGRINAVSVTLPNIHGILGAWATIGRGSNATWAANDGAGNIVPFTSFTEITGAPVIANNAATNLRWSSSSGDASLPTGTTDINTLLFADAARRTVAIPAGATLRLGVSGGIFKTDTSAGEEDSQLSIGLPGSFLTAGGAPTTVGELILNANSNAADQNGIIVNSTITNNGLAPVYVVKSGNAAALLTSSNTYIGGTYIASGRLGASATSGFGTGPVHVAAGAQAFLAGGTHSNEFFVSGTDLSKPTGGIPGAAMQLVSNGTTLTGKVTLLSDAQIGISPGSGEPAVISGQITGSGSLEFRSTSDGGGIIRLTNSNNDWSGDTIIGPGVLQIGGTGEVLPDRRGSRVFIHGGPPNVAPSVLDLNGKTQTVTRLSATGDVRRAIVRSTAPSAATLRMFVDDRSDHVDFGGIIEDGLGTVGIMKIGDGTQTLSGANTYSGPTVLQDGTLRLGSARALPAGANLEFDFQGLLDLNGFNVTLTRLSSPRQFTFIFNNSDVSPSVITFAGGSSVFGGGIVDFAVRQPVSLTMAAGSLELSGTNSYVGPTTLHGGTLIVTGSLNENGSVTVNAGATLSGASALPGSGRVGNVTMLPASTVRPGPANHASVGTLTMSSLTVNGGDLRFILASAGTSDRVNVVDSATFAAPSTITPLTITPGVYTLLTADTLRGVPPTLNMPPATRATFALNFETLADQIRLIIGGSPPKALTWSGANGSEWDLNTTANWTAGATAETFFNLDGVTFGDGPTNRNVVLNTTVFPTSVTVNNSAGNDYTISGTGGIGDTEFSGATSVTKSGIGTLTLGGTNTYAGPTAINGGLLRVTGSIASNNAVRLASQAVIVLEGTASVGGVTGTGFATVGNGTSAALLLADHIRLASLTINAGSEVRIKPAGDTSVLGALAISGDAAPSAMLDLNNNAAIIDYTGTSPMTTVRQQILAGRGTAGFGATWTGRGITSSAAAAAVATEPESRSVGYAENATLPLGSYTNFRGQPVDDTSILMAFTRTGDANLDGLVNDDDVTIVGATYAPGVAQPSWALGDFDFNGFVDDDDVTLLGVFYDPSAPPLAVSPNGAADAVVAVPEPSAITLAVLAGLLFAVAASSRRALIRVS
ncbi:MAG: autotransporter-associated beta strand repeat-containing protein [Pirellulales bacterium]